MKKSSAVGMLLITISICSACKKDWLDAKPNKALVVPAKVADYQALLDNTAEMNDQLPSLSMAGDGDYYVTDAAFNSVGSPYEKSAYLWAPTDEFYNGQPSGDWKGAYGRILKANIVIDGLPLLKISESDQSAYNNVMGSALFYRSLDYYSLSQQYCKVYNESTAHDELGLPLRLSSNVNLKLKRASLKETYDQIINDLEHSITILPVTPLFPTRPSKPAAFALLSRLYLSEENYGKALLYADSCLQLKSDLMDFNQLTPGAYDPGIPQFNKEVIFWARLGLYATMDNYVYIADPKLVQSYAVNDLRSSIFLFNYAGNIAFWGSYIGDGYNNFGGIATDEMYLTRAECYARSGMTLKAMSDLNLLLKNRYKTGSFAGSTAANADEALALIVAERRKELCFRNIRWTDLRRLNKDPRFQVTLTRTINGNTYTLPPNSPRYVLPLDPIEVSSGGLEQNQR